jgi:hypothetical protein
MNGLFPRVSDQDFSFKTPVETWLVVGVVSVRAASLIICVTEHPLERGSLHRCPSFDVYLAEEAPAFLGSRPESGDTCGVRPFIPGGSKGKARVRTARWRHTYVVLERLTAEGTPESAAERLQDTTSKTEPSCAAEPEGQPHAVRRWLGLGSSGGQASREALQPKRLRNASSSVRSA